MSVGLNTLPKPCKIEPKLVAPFVQSVRAVLSTMAGLTTTTDRPRLNDTQGNYDCSGIISFSGQVVGTAAVRFSRETATNVVTKFAGMEIEPGTSDFADAIGELANMIAGAAKKDLGLTAAISVPTVVMGHGHILAVPSDIPCVLIPCSSPAGEFVIEVSLRSAVVEPQSTVNV